MSNATAIDFNSQILGLRKLLPASVDSQLIDGGESGLTQLTLKRWLIARKGGIRAASRDLTAHAAWRAAWTPKQRVLEEEVLADIKQSKFFLQGPDRHGRGVGILQARKHTMTDVISQQRFITYCIDGMLASCNAQSNPDGKFVAIFELQGLQLQNLDATGLKNTFKLLQNHYVEQLAQLVMVGAPTIFWGLWRVVSPFIDSETRKKVVFVGAGATAKLLEDLGAQVLPHHLGGTSELIPVEAAWKQLLLQRQQQQQLASAELATAAVSSTDCCQDVSNGGFQALSRHDQAADAAVLIQTA